MLASRGQRENEDGSRTGIGDAGVAAALRPVARNVWVRTAVATALAAAALVLV